MSINSALLSGVSGLLANAAKLGTISDNIANVNTVGYKRNQTDFQTIVTALSGGRGTYSAGGVLAQSSQKVSQLGQLQRTGNATDLGINGAGFFVTTERPENLTASDARSFTRAGAFTLDEFGFLQNSAGLYLQGWAVDEDGEIAFDPSDLTRLQSINISQVGGAVEQTTRSSLIANLNSDQPISVDAAAYDLANPATTMSGTNGADGVPADFELSIPVTDSKGARRNVMISFLKAADATGTAIPNTWNAEIRAVPASDVERDGAVQNGLISAGLVKFTPGGALDVAGSTLFTGPNATLNLQASDATLAAGEVKWAPALGVSAQTVQLELAGGLTQYSSPNFVEQVTSDGTALGSLASIQIDKEGYVNAIFDNGVTRRVAQVAIATFPNPDGLKALSGNAYLASNTSGSFSLKTPGTGGSGLLSPATLEASTVDLSTEFTGLITTQRAYSASSKIITTADEMLDELIRIKR